MQLNLKSLTGANIKIEVEPKDTPADIKEMVQQKEGIPPEQQKLIWDGKQMDDNKTIEEYKISAGATLHLVLALRGGC
ncbi:uncharacterized protein SAPINGB_P003920 [Magnusiomyces paraingens]|uniref:Ubiquitin-like domain-containing protein n=1 Tax=Magnusiomyces paraingens TaxID=2606893 RepID=A0A5E8BX97_9ASCO|nr:uncharacterized protein SAPINGB_P003920 [Saprochaete ingens]VVT54127.1 unnamed protein product [Saprochaete ingens]